MGRSRTLELDYDGRTWGRKGVPAELARRRGQVVVDADAAILQVAHVTRPPSLAPLHLATTWSWLRYFSAISPQRRLSLDRTWDEIDPHQKTVLSDDWGMGFATLVVQQIYRVWAWVPAHHLARHASSLFTLHRSKAKTGPAKSPDFVGLTARGTLVVLECKGTQTSRDFSISQVKKGVPQKRALRISSSLQVEASLVAGLFVPLAAQAEDPRLYLVDPPAEQALERLGGPSLRNWIVRLQLAAQFGLLGASSLQTVLLGGEGTLETAVRDDEARFGRPARQVWRRAGRAALGVDDEVEVVADVDPRTIEVIRRAASPDAAAAAIWAGHLGPDAPQEVHAAEVGGPDEAGLRSPTGFRLAVSHLRSRGPR